MLQKTGRRSETSGRTGKAIRYSTAKILKGMERSIPFLLIHFCIVLRNGLSKLQNFDYAENNDAIMYADERIATQR